LSPLISVVVPTVNRPELVAKCIDGVLAGDFRDLEVVVVDQSRDDRTRRGLDERFGSDARVRYVHTEVSGAAHARNLGAELASGSILAFLDDDAIPGPRWLEAYAAAFRDIRPTPGLVVGPITPAWEASRPSWLHTELLHVVGAYRAGEQVRDLPAGDLPMSGNLALPATVMREVGGFDEQLGFDVRRSNPLLGGEDSHLGLKVLRSGRRLCYHPDAEVRHLVSAAKLTPRYLLRRLYWNGRTYVQLRRRQDGDRRSWLEVLRDARLKRRRAGPRGDASGPSVRASLTLAVALSAFAFGALAETVAAMTGPQRMNR
jgi:GT2 family glycosyltransferase